MLHYYYARYLLSICHLKDRLCMIACYSLFAIEVLYLTLFPALTTALNSHTKLFLTRPWVIVFHITRSFGREIHITCSKTHSSFLNPNALFRKRKEIFPSFGLLLSMIGIISRVHYKSINWAQNTIKTIFCVAIKQTTPI